MPQSRKEVRIQPSMPQWTALPGDDPPSSSVPSEDEIFESSQDMRDELLSSPSPAPLARKRKQGGTQLSPLRPPSAVSNNKRPRLNMDGSHIGSGRARSQSDEDDVPASAHAKPVKRPLPPSSARRATIPASTLISRAQAFEKSRGPVPTRTSLQMNSKESSAASSSSSKFPDRNVARKTATNLPKLWRTSHANSTSERPIPAAQDKERRKTLPDRLGQIDLTVSDSDKDTLSTSGRRKVVAPLYSPNKKYEGIGQQSDPIVLTDSDDEVPPHRGIQPRQVSLPASHQGAGQPETSLELEEENGIDFGSEIPRQDSPLPASIHHASTHNTSLVGPMHNETMSASQSPKLSTLVPALDHMEISPPLTRQTQDSEMLLGISDPMDIDQSPQLNQLPEPAPPARVFTPLSNPSRRPTSTAVASPARKLSFHPLASPVAVARSPPQPSSSAIAPPLSQAKTSPQRRVHITSTLYSGKSGFFKSVHERRASGGHVSSQTSPQSVQTPVESPTSPFREERASDGYTSSAGAGHELPPSSEASRAGSVNPPLRPSSTASLPLTETAKAEVPARPASQSPSTTGTAHPGEAKSALKLAIASAKVQLAKVQDNFIDLTGSDSEEYTGPAVWSGPEDVASTTRLLADIAPEIFGERAALPPPVIAAPIPRSGAPTLDMIKAAQRSKARKQLPTEPVSDAPSSGSSDSFPVPRRVSIDVPAVKSKKSRTAHDSSSGEDVPQAQNRSSPNAPSTSASDDVDMDEDSNDDTPKKAYGRRRRSQKQRVESPQASGSEFEDGDEQASGSESEIRDLLLDNKRSETPVASGSPGSPSPVPERRYPRRERKAVQRQTAPLVGRETRSSSSSSHLGLAIPAKRGRRPAVARNGPTEEALVPAMGSMGIWSDDDDDDDDDDSVLTWKKHGQALACEYANIEYRARDLPFNLQDRMMSLPIEILRADDMQLMTFKSMISVGAGDDEPDAPEINIINDVDDELSPPFEFHYTNKMYHGDDVPKPDVDHLDHCNCVGICKPERCPCAKKQMRWVDIAQWKRGKPAPDPPGGFLYDKDGRIIPDYHDNHPIFECNAKCRCDDEWCQNRVVQKGRKVKVNIKKTPNKGWGVFAGQNIPAHTFIGIYSGEILTDADGAIRGEKYDEFGRTYLFNLDAHHMRKWAEHQGKKWKVAYCIDAYHAGNFTRYLNHSCDPNCSIASCYINDANIEKPLLTIWTLRDVVADEELCFSYFGEPDETDFKPMSKKEREKLTEMHSLCQCGARRCTGRMWKFNAEEDGSTDGDDD